MKVCGIDEAGRGPLIGPLVMAGVMVEEENRELLKKLEVKDSKLLTKKRREDLFDRIKDISEYFILIVEPEEIDAALNNPDLNLNKLEGLKIAEIINNLNPEKVIVDAPSTNIESFKEYLIQFLDNKEVDLTLEHKADEKYEVCSAASILAKVIRDREIENIQDKHGDCGSGYPSDPKTKEFLKENWDKHPQVFRKTWATYENIVNSKKQKNLKDF